MPRRVQWAKAVGQHHARAAVHVTRSLHVGVNLSRIRRRKRSGCSGRRPPRCSQEGAGHLDPHVIYQNANGVAQAITLAESACRRSQIPETPPLNIQGSKNPGGGLGEKSLTSGGGERSELPRESARSESDDVGELEKTAACVLTTSAAKPTASTATRRVCKQSASLEAAEAFAIARAKLSCATSLSRLQILSDAVASSPFRARDTESALRQCLRD